MLDGLGVATPSSAAFSNAPTLALFRPDDPTNITGAGPWADWPPGVLKRFIEEVYEQSKVTEAPSRVSTESANQRDRLESLLGAISKTPNRIAIETVIQERLGQLKSIAIEEKSPKPSRDSERALLQFLRACNLNDRPNIFLDNGEFTAQWQSENGEQITLHFHDLKNVQYIIFCRPPDSERVMSAAGSSTIKGVMRLIESQDLRRLIEA